MARQQGNWERGIACNPQTRDKPGSPVRDERCRDALVECIKPKTNKKPQQRLTDWGKRNKFINTMMTYTTEVQTIKTSDSQASTPKIWDRATTQANIGDTIHAPYTPVMKVVNKDVYSDGRVWLKVKPTSASCYVEEWVLDPEEDDLQPPPPNEFEQGFNHGRLDAIDKSIALYTKASCEYSKAYLQGYNALAKPSVPTPAPKPLTWSVTHNSTYPWYVIWVDGRAIGRAFDYEEGVRIAQRTAQKYVSSDQFRQEYRERLLGLR